VAHSKTPDMQLANEKTSRSGRCMWPGHLQIHAIYRVGTKRKKEPEENKYDYCDMTDKITSFRLALRADQSMHARL